MTTTRFWSLLGTYAVLHSLALGQRVPDVSTLQRGDAVASITDEAKRAEPAPSGAPGWVSRKPTNARLDFGLALALGFVKTAVPAASWSSVPMTGGPGAIHADVDVTTEQEVLSSVQASGGAGRISDDFSRNNLGPLWEYVDPLAGGAVSLRGVGSADARLVLAVPAGLRYDPWARPNALRVRRPWNQPGFDVAVAFESNFELRYQIQGLLVEDVVSGGFLRFDIHYDGTRLRAFAATNLNGTPVARLNTILSTGPSVGQRLQLRVRQQGDKWFLYTGSAVDPAAPARGWRTVGSFRAAFAPTHLGLFAGNGGNNPAFEARFDWTTDVATPLHGEDQMVEPDTAAPFIHGVQLTGNPPAGVQVQWRTDEPTTGRVRYGLTTTLELGEVPSLTAGYSHDVNVNGLLIDTSYYFGVLAMDAVGFGAQSAPVPFTTNSAVDPIITFWYTDTLPTVKRVIRLNALGRPQAFGNVLGNVSMPNGSVVSANYVLRRAGATVQAGPLVRGPDTRRLLRLGDFNIEIPLAGLAPGFFDLEVTATDQQGDTSLENITVELVGGAVWPFGALQFSPLLPIAQQIQPVDGAWTVEAAGARPLATGYDRILALGEESWTEYEVTGSFVVHSVEAPGTYPSVSGTPLVGIGVRWDGHSGNAVPRNGSWPTGAFAWFSWNVDHITGRFRLHTNQFINNVSRTAPMVLGDRYWFRVRAIDVAGIPYYKYSIWRTVAFDPNLPPHWEMETPGVAGDPANGSILLIAHHVDATFGDVTVTDLSP